MQFPRDSSNALYPLDLLERARRAPSDAGGDLVIGIARPGRARPHGLRRLRRRRDYRLRYFDRDR
jgi:hypothetical protein